MCHGHDCRRIEGLVEATSQKRFIEVPIFFSKSAEFEFVQIMIWQSADYILFCFVSQSTISQFIIQQIVTLSKYGHDAPDICHP